MLLHESRRPARSAPDGQPVLLEDQDRSRWSQPLIAEGTALVARALGREGAGSYALQAAIAAGHAEAPAFEATDWNQIVGLYQLLLQAEPSPVVALNQAVAMAMRDGPEEGLGRIDALLAGGELAAYQPAHAARADLLRRLGRDAEARAAYARALELTELEPEREFLRRRLAQLGAGLAPSGAIPVASSRRPPP
jgi:RNA polymerase sigma-70 factor (ECF subfamily)